MAIKPTIHLPLDPTDRDILNSVRSWLELLAKGDYAAAVEAIHWSGPPDPEALRKRVEGFFGPQHVAAAVNPRQEVLDRTEIYRTGIGNDCKAVVGFFIPLANDLGIWTTFIVRSQVHYAYFEFEIFHA